MHQFAMHSADGFGESIYHIQQMQQTSKKLFTMLSELLITHGGSPETVSTSNSTTTGPVVPGDLLRGTGH